MHRFVNNNTKRTGLNLAAVVLHPYSRGRITLASADPFDRPIIDPNILSDARDREVAKASKCYEAVNVICGQTDLNARIYIFQQYYKAAVK